MENLPGLPRKTEEYNRLDASAFLASAGDDHSLRHHRPENVNGYVLVIVGKRKKNINSTFHNSYTI